VAAGVDQRAAVSEMRLQIREIQPQRMEASLRSLLAAVGQPDGREWRLERFQANHAASRVEMLALLARAPRDRVGSVSWQALISSGRVARTIVRRTSWNQLPDHALRLARTAANRALLDARRTGLSAEFLRWTWEADHEALDSHLIDRAAFDALSRGDLPAFLAHRAERLRTEVTAFLSHRAGVGEPLLFPVTSYYDDADTAGT
jgi:hypothetical protein